MRNNLVSFNILQYFLLLILLVFIFPFFSGHISAATGALDGSRECLYKGVLNADGTYNTAGGVKDKSTFPACTSIDTGALGFKIPSLGDLLTFVIRAFFVFAGLAALFYMLLGAFAWVTSGGDAEAVGAAQQKIQAAVVGMLIIVGVLAIIWTLEQVIFNRRICMGLSCPLTLPGIIESKPGINCCVCVKPDGTHGSPVNSFLKKCNKDGTPGDF